MPLDRVPIITPPGPGWLIPFIIEGISGGGGPGWEQGCRGAGGTPVARSAKLPAPTGPHQVIGYQAIKGARIAHYCTFPEPQPPPASEPPITERPPPASGPLPPPLLEPGPPVIVAPSPGALPQPLPQYPQYPRGRPGRGQRAPTPRSRSTARRTPRRVPSPLDVRRPPTLRLGWLGLAITVGDLLRRAINAKADYDETRALERQEAEYQAERRRLQERRIHPQPQTRPGGRPDPRVDPETRADPAPRPAARPLPSPRPAPAPLPEPVLEPVRVDVPAPRPVTFPSPRPSPVALPRLAPWLAPWVLPQPLPRPRVQPQPRPTPRLEPRAPLPGDPTPRGAPRLTPFQPPGVGLRPGDEVNPDREPQRCRCPKGRRPRRKRGECKSGYFRERPSGDMDFITWSTTRCQ